MRWYTDDIPHGGLHRLEDRIVGGAAVQYDGSRSPTPAARSYMGINALGYGAMSYFETASHFMMFSPNGGVAAAFATRASDDEENPDCTIAVAAFADGDKDGATVWCYYGHAVKRANSNGCAFVEEVDIANQNATQVAFNPYQMGNPGTTAAHWIGAGGESAQLEAIPCYPIDVAIGVVTTGDSKAAQWAEGETVAAGDRRRNGAILYSAQNAGVCGAIAPVHTVGTTFDGGVTWMFSRRITPSRFRFGWATQNLALVGSDGDGGLAHAGAMARGHQLTWFYGGAANAVGGAVRSDNDNAYRQTRLVFKNTGAQLVGVKSDLTTEAPAFDLQIPTLVGSNVFNYVQFVATQNGNAVVKLAAQGPDNNIHIIIQPKGWATAVIPTLPGLNYASDTAAAAAGIPIGGLYHTAGVVHVRLT